MKALIVGFLKDNAANIYGVHDNSVWSGRLGAGRLDAGASLQDALSEAYTGDYCNSCPSETTYLSILSISSNKPSHLRGYFYNKYIIAGRDTSDYDWAVRTNDTSSTSMIATTSITLKPEFHAIASSSNSFFSARIEPCTLQGRGAVSSDNNSTEVMALQQQATRLKVYPNPAKTSISVIFDVLNDGKYDIEVINSVGMTIKKISKNANTTGADKTDIDVKNLPNGMYNVVVRTGNKTYTFKFIKIR